MGLGRLWLPSSPGRRWVRPQRQQDCRKWCKAPGQGEVGVVFLLFCTALCPGAEPGGPETAHSWVLRVCAQPAREGDGS